MGLDFQTTAVSRTRPTRMLRGDAKMKRARTPCKISKIQTTAWNPDGIGVICRSERPADAGGTGGTCGRKSCKCFWCNDSAVKACLCENLAKYC